MDNLRRHLYLDYISEGFTNIQEIPSISVHIALLILEQIYGLILDSHADSVCSVVITSDRKYIISGGGDNNIRIWNLQYNKQEAVLQGHTDTIRSLVISSDNQYIISGSGSWKKIDNTVRIWNLRSKR